jgi:hypothetical protein
MKEIQIFVPDQVLKDVNDMLKESQVGGMSHYRIQRKFKIRRSSSRFGHNEVYS